MHGSRHRGARRIRSIEISIFGESQSMMQMESVIHPITGQQFGVVSLTSY